MYAASNVADLPTADVTLFEMQNHLYICNICGQQAQQAGKQIKWVEQPGASSTPTLVGNASGARVLTSSLPPNSLFAMLNVPLTASVEEIEAAIKQRMRLLLREDDTPERSEKIEQLHEWQEKIDDPDTFEDYRNSFKGKRHEGQALSVGGRLVYTTEEFLSACEASREGWADGERYLRMGQLQHWIIFQIENRDLANKMRFYQSLKNMSTFRAFNEALYCMVPERPFRFYSEEAWEPVTRVPSAATPEELAQKCDLHWHLAEAHLYAGSLAYWLGDARGVPGLKEYYKTTIASFANKGKERGLGLELLLEKAVPALPRPKLVVTFDGVENEYTLKGWDREIPHQPVTVKVTNTTRGFTSIDLLLEQRPSIEPQWIFLNNSAPVHIASAPGDGAMPAIRTLTLVNLSTLQRGKTYRRTLTMNQAGDPGKPPITQQFPITIKTQNFFAGLRGILWRWGLRGGLVGFGWNFIVGTLLAFLLYLIIPAVVPISYLYNPTYSLSFSSCLQYTLAGAIGLLQGPEIAAYPAIKFPLIVGAIMGLIGFGVGNGKGHTNYTEKRSAATFRTWGFWFAVAYVVALLVVDQEGISIIQAFQYGSMVNILTAFLNGGGSIVIGLLTIFIAFMVASTRYRAEKYLRKRYKGLLNPPGRA